MALQDLFKANALDEYTLKKENNDTNSNATLNPLIYDTIMKETY